jgi:MarR family transcriptional regulator, 2-MHQ and catechol-resistance regulon repressor
MPTHFNGTPRQQRALNAYIKLYRASESVSARINAHLAEHKLTVSQFGVLEALYHLGPLHQAQLAQKILKTTGNLTHVIDHLEARGLVERQRQQDRRYIAVHLTAAGEALIADIFPQHVQRVVDAFDCLTDAEQAELERLCKKLGLEREDF